MVIVQLICTKCFHICKKQVLSWHSSVKSSWLNVVSYYSEKSMLTKSLADVELELNCLRSKLEESKHAKQEATLEVIKLSLVVRKPDFCICENKDADQLRGNREADQRLCFRYTDSTIPLPSKSKFQASSHLVWLYSPVCVGPGWKPRRPVFSERGSINVPLSSIIFGHPLTLLRNCKHSKILTY